ncbi:hypothetical protein J7J90_01625 [Candidatus Micrarchaeota archaeon]|nr:hypothetical protein [Candidatus Micrarchaeota archaeon]
MKDKNEKKTIEGELFHEIEEFGGKKYEHIGFRDKNNMFGDMMASFVPKVGMRRKARLTIEIIDDEHKD